MGVGILAKKSRVNPFRGDDDETTNPRLAIALSSQGIVLMLLLILAGESFFWSVALPPNLLMGDYEKHRMIVARVEDAKGYQCNGHMEAEGSVNGTLVTVALPMRSSCSAGDEITVYLNSSPLFDFSILNLKTSVLCEEHWNERYLLATLFWVLYWPPLLVMLWRGVVRRKGIVARIIE